MKRFRVKRKTEKWVSNNRVLLGSSKKDPGRNPNFDTEETKLLISLWGDPIVQKTLITTHRKHTVIAKLADQMNDYGYNRSTEEINTRIKNLKCFYNRLKKDVDAGMTSGITWKHYAAMDEIMTRSIFSVRPNEIPKPSLRYQMEQELEEKRTKLRNDDSSMNGNNCHVVDENVSCSSLSSKEETEIGQKQVDESMDFAEKNESLYDNGNGDDCFTAIKTEIEDVPLMVAKEEPVDEDLEIITDETHPNSDINAPILNDYITKVSPTTSSHFISTNNVTVSTNSIVNTSQIQTSVAQSIVISNPTTNGNPPHGKISLVPTNFLLQKNSQPKPKPIQIRHPPPQRIICATPNSQPNSGIVSTANNGRMKVLFVNAFNNGTTQNVTSAPKEFPLPNASLMAPTNSQHPIESGIGMNYLEQPKSTRLDEADNHSRESSLELLIHKLIESQNENNAIQRQRLEVAQERLEFEKTLGNKLLEAVISLKPKQSENNDEKQLISIVNNLVSEQASSENEKSIIPEIIDEFNNYHMLTPKVEKDD